MTVPETSKLSRTKRLLFWQITLLPAYALFAFLFVGGVLIGAPIEAARLGPYTTWFNQHLQRKAIEAGLVGAPEKRVRAVLGAPDNVRQFWEVIEASGQPARGAQFITTYEYYPYPVLPISKFQVHCAGGVVRGLEMFDD